MDDREFGFGDLTALGPMEDWPIGRLFLAAARLSGPVMWRRIERHGISPAGFFLLRALAGDDCLRAGDLAKRLMISPATVTSVVDTLERNGHVERQRDRRDRRAVVVRITESGLALVKVTGETMADDLWDMYEVVDEEDEPAVRRFLIRLIERFGSAQSGRPPGEATTRPGDSTSAPTSPGPRDTPEGRGDPMTTS
ncbi:MarR family winged helix-turn-helix transcriptional regulator [Actinomadura sp. SCN-SB]|uniref:MarR family winged helix-turn-helix transcriptional regulator n=1 Tax=Actinomadura sp. SCN-SB TaxID=3373092 RepID=UPI0037515575